MPKVRDWSTGQVLKWDAWNRLVKLQEGNCVVATYRYDGSDRRISKALGAAGAPETRHFYYSDDWQVLEERVGAATTAGQFTWGKRYLDDLVLRDREVDGVNQRLYATLDQWHVAGVADPDGEMQERYAYSAFGDTTVLTPAFSPRTHSLYGWETTYGAYQHDAEMDLYQARRRYLLSGLGRWLSRDPIEFSAGDANFYAYAKNSPSNYADPNGLQTTGREDSTRVKPIDGRKEGSVVDKVRDDPQPPVGGCACVKKPGNWAIIRPKGVGGAEPDPGRGEVDCGEVGKTTVILEYEAYCGASCDCKAKTCKEYVTWVCRLGRGSRRDSTTFNKEVKRWDAQSTVYSTCR